MPRSRKSSTQHRRRSHTGPRACGACSVGLAATILLLFEATPALALGYSKSAAGNNHAAAHSLATGLNIRVGVLEGNGGVNTGKTKIDDDGRLIKNLNFIGCGAGPLTADPPGTPPATDHATLVTDIIGSSHATYTGVAPASRLYVGAVSVSSEMFDGLDWLYRAYTVAVFNISFGIGDNDGGAHDRAKSLDYHMRTFDTLVVKSAGNSGAQISSPGDFYNGLTVGSLDSSFTARASYSSYLISGESGSTVNYWPKPEVVAAGENVRAEAVGPGSGTSFSAPHVTGIVALLQQGTTNTAGLRLGAPGQANHLAIKAIIMNSARKRHINAPENSYPLAADYSGTSAEVSDGDYLNGTTFRSGSSSSAPKTGQWTPSKWSYTNGLFSTDAPLDDELGTGAVDAKRALIQLDGGKQGPGPVGPIGWDVNVLSPGMPRDYSLNFEAGDAFLTVTLTWDRPISRSDAGKPGLDYLDNFYALDLPNIDLQVWYKGNLYAESVSLYNSEHLHIPLLHRGAPNDYLIRVLPLRYVNNTPYGLAWWTVAIPEPSTALLVALSISVLLFHRRKQ